MCWLLFLWFTCFCCCLPAYGNRHDHPVTSAPQSTKEADTGNFPMDLMTASTSAVQKGNPSKMKLDEDRKTLSQQVADGKYGLIQKELFTNPISRPGVLSYDNNSEVPKDNVNNLGGLNKSEIWLAENHLLVLKGGVFPLIETFPEYSKPAWPPIDDYDAPRRQVKLPKHPKVPPPFPVQLTDGGPLQILGTNFTRTINDSFFSPPYAVPPLEGFDPGNGPIYPPPYPYPPNATSGETPFPNPPYPPPVQGTKPADGLPPSQSPFPVNGGLPPFFDSLPPGSAILPPPNITDQFDEDDLSIYYPPPYSFYYPKDNSTAVPPGPLVPGIVLPPPPDFFSLYTKSPPTITRPKPTTSTPPTTKQTYPVTTPLIPTTPISKTRKPQIIKTKTTIPSKPTTTRIKPVYQTTTLPEFIPTGFIDKKPQTSRNKTISVTVLRPVKPTRKPPIYIYDNTVPNKPFEEYGPPPPPSRHRGRITITTTKVPLRAYFTTSGEVDKNLVTHIPEIEQYTTRGSLQKHRPKPATQIYYYDDTPLTNSISTPYPVPQTNRYINLTKDYFTNSDKDARKYPSKSFVPVQQPRLEPQYYYLPTKAFITQRPPNKIVQQTLSPNHFKTHLIKLQEQIQAYQRPPKPYKESVYNIQNTNEEVLPPKPVYKQNVFNFQNNNQEIHSSRPVYKQTVYEFQNDNHELLPPKPVFKQDVYQIQNNNPEVASPKPVYQYSFEVANYKEQHEKLQIPTLPEHTRQGKVRNLPKYTVQIEPALEITTTERPIHQNPVPTLYYQEDYNAPRASPQKYYPDYNYQNQQYSSASVTPHPSDDQTYTVTPNPVYQTYYTKQDEQYFDDMTKTFFTTFGKKISTSTTPIPTVAPTNHRQIVYSQPERNPRIRTNHPNYFPNSPLRGDVVVNYVNEAPAQNIHPEYVQLKQQPQTYPQVSKQVPQFAQTFLPQINQNYRKKIPKNNIQTIQAISIPTQGEGKHGSFISYELPGDDGAHFYFLTPQLIQKDGRGGTTYYYTPQSNPRIRRNS